MSEDYTGIIPDRMENVNKTHLRAVEWMYGILYVRIVHVPSRLCYLALCLVQRLLE